MSEPAILCRDLLLDYGHGNCIGPLSFSIPQGICLALVGENGAGKSSLINMLLGLRPWDSGDAFLFGQKAIGGAGIGYLPEVVDFPERSTAKDVLLLHMSLMHISQIKSGPDSSNQTTPILPVGNMQGGSLENYLENYLDGFGLVWTHKPIKDYSKGMKQRLGLAIAMLQCSKLLILDEPNSGLDPVGIAMLRRKLDELKTQGVTILISTHRLAEVMQVADSVLVLHKGKVAGESPMTNFPDFPAFESYFLSLVK